MLEFRQDNIRNVKKFLRAKKFQKIGDHEEVPEVEDDSSSSSND